MFWEGVRYFSVLIYCEYTVNMDIYSNKRIYREVTSRVVSGRQVEITPQY